MNTRREEELINLGYVNVTGILCKVFDCRFVVPSPEDYPDKRYIAGRDFIFYFDNKSCKTWYKCVDLEDGEYRSSLFFIDDLLSVEDSSCSININMTAFAYPFNFDENEFRIREMCPGYEFDRNGDEISCEVAYMMISGNIASRVDDLIRFLMGIDELSLKPLPNTKITSKFGVAFSTDNPVYFTNLRHAYMYIVLHSQRNFKFPGSITLKQFKSLVSK